MAETSELMILVDEDDREIGIADKLETHRRGALHRAISVIVWDSAGRLLLQKRAAGKYHSGGSWTNACCGHPRPGEDVEAAALRRLEEEMGFTCPLESLGTIRYRAELDHGMIEHELVHMFRGLYDGTDRAEPGGGRRLSMGAARGCARRCRRHAAALQRLVARIYRGAMADGARRAGFALR